mmetsp:Transcript_11687/g.31463  ORF Transcript_11687/g.31463 Transcript_11687/m.31463 type:complete len:353 (-) Transcript_11687:53-1111(-)
MRAGDGVARAEHFQHVGPCPSEGLKAAAGVQHRRVVFGGRWLQLEEQRDSLEARLGAYCNEATEATNAASAAKILAEAADKMSAAWRGECERATQCVEEYTSEVSHLRLALSAARACGEEAETRADHLGEAHEALVAEHAVRGRALDASMSEAARFRGEAADAEAHSASEAAALTKAEANCERLQAELCMATGRLANRATHVDLLLRDKERLCGQLARARQKTDATSAPGETAVERGVAPGVGARRKSATSSAGALGRGDSTVIVDGTTLPENHTKATTVGGVRPMFFGKEGKAMAELTRRLWHTERALERERRAHEATKFAFERGSSKDEAVGASEQQRVASDTRHLFEVF